MAGRMTTISLLPVHEKLAEAVRTLGLEKYRRHLFLCADASEPKRCGREASIEAWTYLKRRLGELGLVGPEPLVYRTKANFGSA